MSLFLCGRISSNTHVYFLLHTDGMINLLGFTFFLCKILKLGMIRPFLTKALQPPEDQAVINALEVLHQLVNHLASLRCKQKAACSLVNAFLLLNNCFSTWKSLENKPHLIQLAQSHKIRRIQSNKSD